MIPIDVIDALRALEDEAECAWLVSVSLRIGDVRMALHQGADGYEPCAQRLEERAAALDVVEHPTIPVELGEAARMARDIYLRAAEVLRAQARKEAA